MNQITDRPYSTPPTNIQITNDYVGVDRGLFLTREDVPRYLRVISAEWTSYGPSASPGILRLRIGRYETKPMTDEDYSKFEYIRAPSGEYYFDLATSGPIHSPILVEYWAKFIYYNYYVLHSNTPSILENTALINSIRAVGKSFTNSLVPAINTIENKAIYGVAHGEPLSLSEYTSLVTPVTGNPVTLRLTSEARTNASGFDPVLESSRLI